MHIKKLSAAALAVALSAAILSGCGAANSSTSAGTTSTATGSSTSASVIAATTESIQVSMDSSDYYFDWQAEIHTTLDMSSGSQTITKSGIYEITGTLADGSLIVDIDKSTDKGTVYLILNNTNITSASSAPIYVKDAKKVVLVLENGTTNTISQGSGVVVNSDNEPSAAIFSKADLTITGSGTLSVTSDFNDGITSKDTLKITDGTLVINSNKDGIVGKDVIAVEKAVITITAGKDGMRSTNDTDTGQGNILLKDGTYTITANNDAIQAYGLLQVDGGTFNLTSGGGYTGSISANVNPGSGGMGRPDTVTQATETTDASSTSDSKKALKATGGIIINGGAFTIASYEDSVNSSGNVVINGGTLTIQAGDDAIHSDTDVTISGGTITIANAYEGIEGKNITINSGDIKVTSSDDGINVNDAAGLLTITGGNIYLNAGGDGLDSNGSAKMTGGTVYVDGPTDSGNGAIDYDKSFTISGGTIIAAGSSGMAQSTDSSSSQPSILMYYTAAQAAGTTLTVKDESGNTVASFTPAKQYSSAAISAPGLKTGQTYTLYSGETKVVNFTLSDTVTYLSESGVTANQSAIPGGGTQMGGGGQFNGGKPAGNG